MNLIFFFFFLLWVFRPINATSSINTITRRASRLRRQTAGRRPSCWPLRAPSAQWRQVPVSRRSVTIPHLTHPCDHIILNANTLLLLHYVSLSTQTLSLITQFAVENSIDPLLRLSPICILHTWTPFAVPVVAKIYISHLCAETAILQKGLNCADRCGFSRRFPP